MYSGCAALGVVARLVKRGPACWLGGFLLMAVAAPADPALTASNVWTLALASEADATPAVGRDGTIYTGDFLGQFHAITAAGVEQWRFQAGREIKSSPALAEDGTIYFGSRDRQFYALMPTGKLKWKFETGAWVDSSPAIATDGTIYFGSWDKSFYALNADGSLKWKFAVGGVVDSSPAIAADGTIYFGAHNKRCYALSPAGQPRWNFLTGAEISSSPAVGEDGDVYLSSTDGNLYRLKADGTERWHCRIGGGSASSPVLAENGNVVIAAGQRNVLVSPAGAVVWSSETACWLDETPAVAQGLVCFSAPWRRVWAILPTGQSGLWDGPTIQNLSSSPVIAANGLIYCCCGANVVALQPPTPLVSAKSSWPMFRANARHTGRVEGH